MNQDTRSLTAGSVCADKAAEPVFAEEQKTWWQYHLKTFRILLSLFLGLLLWEIVGRLSNPLIFVPFSQVVGAFLELARSGDLWRHTYVSFVELVVGFSIGAGVGLALGVVIGVSEPVRDMTDPWISVLYSTPYIAVTPLFIIWFGIGITSKAAIVFLAVIFPVLLNTYAGIATAERRLVETGRAFGASNFQIFRWILLPSALPSIVVGLRLAMSRGLIAVVVGELFGSLAGLGFLIANSAQKFDTAMLLAGVFTLAGIAMILVETLKWIEHRMAPWREATE